jgi:polyisoprenoid-binding protein YceI
MDELETWKIDFDRSTLRFRLGEIAGQFDCWGGTVLVDLGNVRRIAVRIWVELSSIDTGSRLRDEAILHTELFEQQWEPGLQFDGDRWEIDASNRINLIGSLGLRGFRNLIAVTIDAPALEVDAAGRPRFVCTAATSVDRKALGLQHPHGAGQWLSDRLLGQKIDMLAHIEAVPN